jgi:hypothetical protein
VLQLGAPRTRSGFSFSQLYRPARAQPLPNAGRGPPPARSFDVKPRIYNDLNKFGMRWIEELPSVVWSLRTTPSRATGFSLFFLVYGVEAILPTNLEYGSPRTKAYDKQNNQTSQEDSLDQLEEAQDVALLYMCTFVLCLIGRPKAHNFWHGPDLARPNLIVGLGRHGPICGPCLGLKSSPWAGLARPI